MMTTIQTRVRGYLLNSTCEQLNTPLAIPLTVATVTMVKN